ncbi:MAG: hypothetical protein J5789_05135 [Oscillospiraceae bacterium]|nr:hypothetical protein [Oscillospiraceae bacterium]
MNRESLSLALTGAMIGVLALSASVFARLHPPKHEETTAALWARPEESQPSPFPESGTGPAALPVLAGLDPEEETAPGPFLVSLRVPDPVPGERLFVCDGLGCPLEGIEPNREGEAVLGPLAPGRYTVCRGQTEAGYFRLYDNASLGETGGRVWTDGEQLRIERFIPGTVRLTVTLKAPGYYTVSLCDRAGQMWNRDLYVSDGTEPEEMGLWVRILDFQGLPPGLYTAVRRSVPLGQVEVSAGETAALKIEIDK